MQHVKVHLIDRLLNENHLVFALGQEILPIQALVGPACVKRWTRGENPSDHIDAHLAHVSVVETCCLLHACETGRGCMGRR
jgi:hypothetical protein